jgi:RNA polymerase sigma-70 factor (ECF subfamily)
MAADGEDETEFARFFAGRYPRMVAVLDLAVGDRDLAEDATQEAFARALERWSRVRKMDRPDGWIYVTAMNLARRDRRGRAHRARSYAEIEPSADLSDGVATRVLVRELVLTLAPRQRHAVVLRYAAGLSVEEVADAMGCALGTAKATLHHALEHMRIEMGASDEG